MSHVPTIIKLMKKSRDKIIVQVNGCRALGYLMSKNVDNKKTIAKMGGIEVILDAMKRHKANANLQDLGCGALVYLAENDDNAMKIAKMGGMKVILDAMKRPEVDAVLVGGGCCILGAIIAQNDDKRKRIAKMGGIKVIFDVMKRHESDVVAIHFTHISDRLQ